MERKRNDSRRLEGGERAFNRREELPKE